MTSPSMTSLYDITYDFIHDSENDITYDVTMTQHVYTMTPHDLHVTVTDCDSSEHSDLQSS